MPPTQSVAIFRQILESGRLDAQKYKKYSCSYVAQTQDISDLVPIPLYLGLGPVCVVQIIPLYTVTSHDTHICLL